MNPLDRKTWGRIGVLMGGCSSEREISLKSGEAILRALQEEGCDAVAVDIRSQRRKDMVQLIGQNQIELAFIALHGRIGEDGTIQTILEELEIPYTGSDAEASAKAFNKSISQKIFENHGLRVAPYVILSKNDTFSLDILSSKLKNFPVIVKPSCQGSSIGINIAKNKNQLQEAVKTAWQYDDEILIEKFISGREMTVGILNDKALAVIEIKPKAEFFSYEAKYQAGMTEYDIPAQIPRETASYLQKEALKAHLILNCRDFSRVDFILDEGLQAYILEVNTIPGFTATSLLPKAAKEAGLSFNQLVLKIVELTYGKKKESKNFSVGH